MLSKRIRNYLIAVIISTSVLVSIFLILPPEKENIPPTIEIENPIQSKNYNTPNLMLNISASDNVAIDTIWYCWGGQNITYYFEIYILFNEGLNTLTVWANDTVGNIESIAITFYIDTSFPLIEFISPSNKSYNTQTALLEISASDNHEIDSIWYNWNGLNISYTDPCEIEFNEGENIIHVWARDTAGNIASTNITFTVDKESPMVEIIGPICDVYTDSERLIEISATDNDGIDTIWYSLNGQKFVYVLPEYFSFNAGFNTLYAYANDSAGNTAMVSETFFITNTNNFSSVWNTSITSTGSSANNQVRIPFTYDMGNCIIRIYWGDGSSNLIKRYNQPDLLHTYATPGVYTINMSGYISPWTCYNAVDKLKLTEIKQWGDIRLGFQGYYFYGCSNLRITATDLLNTTGPMSMDRAFFLCEKIDKIPRMNEWDVSKVYSMKEMFASASLFNESIGDWNVSNVFDMSGMFTLAKLFNHSISKWDVSRVNDMSHMFSGCVSFNQNISNWDVSRVLDMSHMFYAAKNFTQNIGCWNVSRVTNMQYMFAYASKFNQDIGNWDVSKVTAMDYMFFNALVFNQNISRWNVSKVKYMESMFRECHTFNQCIGLWNVSSVTIMSRMFWNAFAFNQSLENWDVSKVTNMQIMFENAISFNQNISRWNVSQVTSMDHMFYYVKLSTPNYDSLLIEWSKLSLRPNVIFSAGTSKYSAGAAATARASIISTFGWTITDGGQV